RRAHSQYGVPPPGGHHGRACRIRRGDQRIGDVAREMTPLEVLDSFPSHEGTLPSLLASRVRKEPARPLLGGEIPHWSYLAGEQAAASLAVVLHDRGVGHGDRVAMVSHNSDLGPLVLLALGRLGAIFV